MILTQEFLTKASVCEAGQKCAEDGNYIGMDYDAVIKDLLRRGLRDDAGWLQAEKSKETYVRMNGSVITMGTTYQVFNPLTGEHIEYPDEQSARAAMVVIGQQIIAAYPINLVQSIANENGDTAWTPVQISTPLIVS